MRRRRRLIMLVALLAVGASISAWINVPPWLVRRRAVERFQLGMAHQRQGNTEAAVAEWRIAAGIDPDYPEPYRKLGEFLLNSADRPDLAAQNFRMLAALEPNGRHVYCNLSKAYALGGELAEARAYAGMAVKSEPGCGLAHHMAGIMLMTDHQMVRGVQELERAAHLAPSSIEFALVLAQAYLDTSAPTQASAVLDGILKREPANARAHYLMGWLLSRGARTPNNVQTALEHFRRASQLDPDSADVYSEWGKLLAETGHPADAETVLVKAWRLNPRQLQVAHTLAGVYRREGKTKEAEQMTAQASRLLDRAARLRVLLKQSEVRPNDPDLNLQLADAEVQDGNLTDALRYVNGVFHQRPNDRRGLQLLEQIYAVGGKPHLAERVHQQLAAMPGTP